MMRFPLSAALPAALASVSLWRRLVTLRKELHARRESQLRMAADGSRLVRRVATRSRIGQAILSFTRACIAFGLSACAFWQLTARGGFESALHPIRAAMSGDLVTLSAPYGIDTLSLLVKAASWLVMAVVVLEQWSMALPLGKTVRMLALALGCYEAFVVYRSNFWGSCDLDDALITNMTTSICALSQGLTFAFTTSAIVCQFAGEYHLEKPAEGFKSAEVGGKKTSPAHSLRVVFLTVGTRGDVQPFVALGKALIKHGHRPVVVTHRKMESFIRSHGIDFRYCGVEFDQHGVVGKAAESASIYAWFREALRKVTRKQYFNVNGHFFSACSEEGENAADLIVSTGHTIGPAMDFAEKLGIPMWCCQLTPHQWMTRSFGAHSYQTSCCGCLNLLRHYSYWGDLSRAYSEAKVASHAHSFRSDVLGLSPADPGLQRVFDMFEVKNFFVASRIVVPQPTDWPIQSNVCGWFFLDQEDYDPPEDLENFLSVDSGKPPVVCINFGSMVLVERTNFIRDAATAALACGKRVLIITGWASPPDDLPEGCFCVQSVPHEYVFNKCCAVIHHGGAGTTARVLQAGVPSVIVPILIGTDQPWWADRVEELNCGVHVRGGNPGLEDIQSALAKVLLSNNSNATRLAAQQDALSRVSRSIAAEDGVLNFVAAVNTLSREPHFLLQSSRKKNN